MLKLDQHILQSLELNALHDAVHSTGEAALLRHPAPPVSGKKVRSQVSRISQYTCWLLKSILRQIEIFGYLGVACTSLINPGMSTTYVPKNMSLSLAPCKISKQFRDAESYHPHIPKIVICAGNNGSGPDCLSDFEWFRATYSISGQFLLSWSIEPLKHSEPLKNIEWRLCTPFLQQSSRDVSIP